MHHPQPIILLVDDDELMCQLLSEELERLKFRTDYALNGMDALMKIRAHDYNLVIMGIGIPGMSEVEVLKEIKSYKPDLPVIILTAAENIRIVDKCFKLGAADYIARPYVFDVLIDSIIDNLK